MVRVQVQLTESQLRLLRETALREGVSLAELIRRAVDAWAATRRTSSEEERRRRAISAAGRFRSGEHDVSARHDHYLVDAFEEH